jgi:hypothetical protein
LGILRHKMLPPAAPTAAAAAEAFKHWSNTGQTS